MLMSIFLACSQFIGGSKLPPAKDLIYKEPQVERAKKRGLILECKTNGSISVLLESNYNGK